MKRALAMGLGLLLATGAASEASAASQIDFSGYYRIYQMNDVNLGRSAGDDSFTDSYWGARLNLDLTFAPTDEIEVFWRLRGPDFHRWGAGNTNRSGVDLGTYHVYGLIKQEWGNIYIGRLDEDLDVYGLATLGYMAETNPIFTTVGPFEEAGVFDGVRYTKEWDNGFGLMAQYAKLSNNGEDSIGRGAASQGQPDNWDSDQDYDRFHVEAAYKWDGGGVSLGAMYDRDATGNPSRSELAAGENAWNKTDAWFLNPAVMHTWGDFSVHFEGLVGWGTDENIWGRGTTSLDRTGDRDSEGYAAYLDFDYSYGPGNVTLGGWYTSGTDLDEAYKRNGKSKSLVGMGGNFFPLIVAYNDAASGFGRVRSNDGLESNGNAISLANNAYENFVHPGFEHRYAYLNTGANIGVADATNHMSGRPVAGGPASNPILLGGKTRIESFNNETEANHWAVALSGNHAFTDNVSMHYAMAYLGMVKPSYRVASGWDGLAADGLSAQSITYTEQDKDLGFEFDLGFSFQLLDNLAFTTAFGYMVTGDAFKTLKGYNEVASSVAGTTAGQAVWEDGKDTYTWYNTLTFSF